MSKEKKKDGNKKKFRLEDIILTMWGVVLAFTVQVLYDALGEPFWTSKMPKVYWGLGITVGLAILLLFYIKRLHQKD